MPGIDRAVCSSVGGLKDPEEAEVPSSGGRIMLPPVFAGNALRYRARSPGAHQKITLPEATRMAF